MCSIIVKYFCPLWVKFRRKKLLLNDRLFYFLSTVIVILIVIVITIKLYDQIAINSLITQSTQSAMSLPNIEVFKPRTLLSDW
jgi:hypothetical protein